MRSLTLRLGPLYSRLAEEQDVLGLHVTQLPAHLQHRLRQHQVQTWQAIINSDAEVIFDTALTGDGKSLAGQLPMLVDGRYALLMFPTNELIEDQKQQLERHLQSFGLTRTCQSLTSALITEGVEQADAASRSSLIRTWFNTHDYLLSNPDLFHLMSSYNYGSTSDQRQHVYQIPASIDYFGFDEFHIFGPPQFVSILNIMNYHKVVFPHRPLKYVFLSATPTSLFKQHLKNSGFRIKEITGTYSPVPADGYTATPIVQPVTLHAHSLGDRGAYAWAQEHEEELRAFYETHPDTKGVFIVNSVATAKRLVTYYQGVFGEAAIAENTGLATAEERRRAREDPQVRLVIATSTIDVGVDFHINLLVFESTGAGTFIQRLGRLGRHPGWQAYHAYALLPDWLVERFAARFLNDTEIERVAFLQALHEPHDDPPVLTTTPAPPIFRPEQEYKSYAHLWGGVQTAHLIVNADEVGKHAWSDVSQALRRQYNRAYGHSPDAAWIGGQIRRYKEMAQNPQELLLIKELTSFRGRSPLTCGIFDETDKSFKTYDLFFLLANTVFYPLEEAQFRHMLEQRGQQQQFERYRSRELGLYVRLTRYTQERESFDLCCYRSFKRGLNKVAVYKTFYISESRMLANHLDDTVNDGLKQLSLVCLVVAEQPQAFKRMHGLSPLFPLYRVRDKDGLEYSLVFGLNAFLAHSLIAWKSAKGEHDDVEDFML